MLNKNQSLRSRVNIISNLDNLTLFNTESQNIIKQPFLLVLTVL
jgi:hypothetical protein